MTVLSKRDQQMLAAPNPLRWSCMPRCSGPAPIVLLSLFLLHQGDHCDNPPRRHVLTEATESFIFIWCWHIRLSGRICEQAGGCCTMGFRNYSHAHRSCGARVGSSRQNRYTVTLCHGIVLSERVLVSHYLFQSIVQYSIIDDTLDTILWYLVHNGKRSKSKS